MKETFGKWFLDVAKYILTALFLTTAFAGMEEANILLFTMTGFLFSISIGFVLLWQSEKDEKRRERNRRKSKKK